MKKYNDEEENTKKKNHKFLNLFSGVLTGMFLCVNAFTIYQN